MITPQKGKVIKNDALLQNIQNLKEHVIISGSTSLHGSAIISSRDMANNDFECSYLSDYIMVVLYFFRITYLFDDT